MNENFNLDEIYARLAKLGIEIPSKEAPKPDKLEPETAKHTDEKYISPRYQALLAEIEYFADGNAPSENNAMYSAEESQNFWFVPEKQVAVTQNDGKQIVLAENALERFCYSVASKWALERDWIPEYRYTLEDNESLVLKKTLECIQNGIPRAEIPSRCFKYLDKKHDALKPDRTKTEYREENCNDADRYYIASLLTTPETLHRLSGENGSLLPLPTLTDMLGQYTDEEIRKLGAVTRLFKEIKEKHAQASNETWLSAQCYILGMSTNDAVEFIYGEQSHGKKKLRNCISKYSRQWRQVLGWIVDDMNERMLRGNCEGLEKWINAVERIRLTDSAERALRFLKAYCLLPKRDTEMQEKEYEEVLRGLIRRNPQEAIDRFKEFVPSALASEYERILCSEQEEEVEQIIDSAEMEREDTGSDGLPF